MCKVSPRFFPNPIKNYLNITFNANEFSEVKIQIFNPNSKILVSETFITEVKKVLKTYDFSTFEAGVYVVRLSVGGEVFQEFVVKLS